MQTVTPEIVGLSTSRLHRINQVMQNYIDRGQVAGVITVIARRGQVAHFGLFGQMDLGVNKPMREDAIFRIFSMTKPITCLAVLMLYEEGALHLQYPVSMFLPEFKDLKVFVRQTETGMELASLERPVTIHDLMTHMAGLGYGIDGSTPVNVLYQQAKLLRPDELLADKIGRIAKIPLHQQPGKSYIYSIATDVLGRLVEVVSGMSLDVFFKRRIFEPLGMVDTDFYVPAEKLERLATLYTSKPDGGLMDVSQYPGDPLEFPFGLWTDKSKKPAFLSGGAGLVSTPADYLRFGLMMRNKGELEGERLVSRKTIELMTAPHLRLEQALLYGVSFGLGVTVLTDPAGAQMLGSPGAYEAGGAANTNWWYDRDEDLMGLLMVQYIHTNPLTIGMDFKALGEQAIDD